VPSGSVTVIFVVASIPGHATRRTPPLTLSLVPHTGTKDEVRG
jgi:hypothetical protein